MQSLTGVSGWPAGAHWRYVVRWERLDRDLEGLGQLEVGFHFIPVAFELKRVLAIQRGLLCFCGM